MSHYLCTTRSGLFLNFTKKIINGAFFGLARDGSEWYIFGSKADDRSKPTHEGYILKFALDAYGNPVILEEFANGLDNGVHQIMVHDGHLYVLETYIQQIRKICLRTKTEEIIYPLPRAIIAWYKYHGMEGSLEDYAHMNALTVQDDRFYISCPKLRSKLNEQGKPDQDRNPTLIRVFSKDWKLIDEIDTGRFFCHDLVIIGHDIYFADATNTICKVNSVTHEVSDVWTVDPVSPDLRKICRGLSIAQDGKVIVGTHDFQGNNYVVDVLEKKQVKIEDTPCCIMKIDGTDYCDEQSPLRQSHIVSGFAKDITFVHQIYEHLKEVHPSHMIEGKDDKPPPIIFDPKLEDWKKPPIYFDEDNTENKKSLRLNTVSLPKGFTESGPFYLYPRGGGMDWHTNINNLVSDSGERHLRMYTLTCTGDSYFMYRHPVSEKIHAVKDIDGQFIVFNLLYPNFKGFWHAVYTKSGSRLSYGMKFGKKQFFELDLPNVWNLPYDPPIIVSEKKFLHHDYAGTSEILNEETIKWLETLVKSIYLFDVRNAKDFKKCSKVGWTNNKIICTNFAQKMKQINDEMFGFKTEYFSECIEYREFDDTYQNKDDWFMDVQNNQCERKLSAIMFLSDPSEYEGGELNMITSNGTIVVSEKRKGGFIVFPSYLLYRFGPIKKGNLKILIGWVV